MMCLNSSMFRVIKGAFTLVESDAIVNGVNSVLLGGGSGCSTFHRAADNILSFKKIVKHGV